jgi:hypothetical protein
MLRAAPVTQVEVLLAIMATANNDSIHTRIQTMIYLIVCGFVCQ